MKAITQPHIIPIGATTINADLIMGWAEHHGFDHLATDPSTPLFRIINALRGLSEDAVDTNLSAITELDLLVEFAGRHCYRSWAKGRETAEYIDNVLSEEHGSIFEHASITFAVSGVSRSLTHEMVRHRAGFAISQESQRYVKAVDVNWVIPPLLLAATDGKVESGEVIDFINACEHSLLDYQERLAFFEEYMEAEGVDRRTIRKRAAESARAHLPNAAETRLTWTGNLRALRHFCETRGDQFADLEIRRFAVALTHYCKAVAPCTFSDFEVVEGDFGVGVVKSKYRKV